MIKIGFLGGGKMAQALAKGFIKSGLSKGELILASCLPEDTGSIKAFEELGSRAVHTNEEVVKYGDVLILAVKPQVVPQVFPALRKQTKLLLSIAMGIPLLTLENNVMQGTPVIRVMPNTPTLVGCGVTVYARGKHADDKHADIAKQLFSSVGLCQEVHENMIDPVTALASSGPAYVYMMIEALADGAVKMGMTRPLALSLAAQTVIGAGTMVQKTQLHPSQLKDDVASPAGSTIAAIHYLERHGFRSALIGAVEAATARCREVAEKN